MKKNISVSSLLIVLAASLWALDGVIRRSLYSLPPINIVFFEHLVGSLILLPIIFGRISQQPLTKKSLSASVVVSLLSGLFGTLLFTSALAKVNYIPFSVVILLQKLQPIFATGSAWLILKEKINPNYLKWAGLAMIAAFFTTFQNGVVVLGANNQTLIAALMAVGAAFCWGFSTSVSKVLLQSHDYLYSTGLRFMFTTIFAFIGVFLLGQANTLSTVSFNQFIMFAFIAVSSGMVALAIYYKGLQNTQAKVSTILELTYPLLAVFLDLYLYKSPLAISQYLAAAVLLFAIYKTAQINH